MAMTLTKVLRGVFEDYEALTDEAAEWRKKATNCLNRVRAGETTIDGKRAEVALAWCAVNYINGIGGEFFDGGKWACETEELKRNMNLLFMLIQRMGTFTYRELLDLFPVLIRYDDGSEWSFGVNDIPYDRTSVASNGSRRLGNIGILTLCGCGIHFQDETEGTTDFDSKIGEGIMDFITENPNPVLRKFYSQFLYSGYSMYYELT